VFTIRSKEPLTGMRATNRDFSEQVLKKEKCLKNG
jgi:hypothetical protein